jgi:hypothetical protein
MHIQTCNGANSPGTREYAKFPCLVRPISQVEFPNLNTTSNQLPSVMSINEKKKTSRFAAVTLHEKA